MYNRYHFTEDGTCQRTHIPEACQATGAHSPNVSSRPVSCSLASLQNLFPEGMDSGDMIVALLLLLMAGDSKEEHDRAMLTLALYFVL